jgi:cystathionine gamma-synthase
MSTGRDPRTIAAANGIAADDRFGAVAPPLYLSSTFAFSGFQQHRGYEYSRTANPGRDLLADTLAQLEGGAGAVVTSSGMAAVDLVLSLARRDDLVVAPHDCYGGTHRLLSARRERGHFDVLFIDQADAAALGAALARNPSLVLIETPSNPLMRVVDIRAAARRAKEAGARVAVDNTFLSPALQKPLSLGADFVIHSTTKYLNGHSDVVGGAVVCADAADVEQFRHWANITASPARPSTPTLPYAGCGRCTLASSVSRRTPPPSPRFCPTTRRSRRCTIRASRPIPAMPSPKPSRAASEPC